VPGRDHGLGLLEVHSGPTFITKIAPIVLSNLMLLAIREER
jgi:hypothetical protein